LKIILEEREDMSVKKAHNHYLGKEGHQKLNCCQAVLSAFADKSNISQEEILKSRDFGGGRAPQGRCGALQAAHRLLKDSPHKIQGCEAVFQAKAGSLRCQEIRSLRKLSCVGCVETIAGYIERSQE